MWMIYKPGGKEEQRFRYDPNKLMSAEREALERRTERDFSDFTQAVLSGNSLCRRALLFMFQKRAHPTIRWDDVDFAWDELELQFSRDEYQLMRDAVEQDSAISDSERRARLDAIDLEMSTAIDDDEAQGKARLPIAG